MAADATQTDPLVGDQASLGQAVARARLSRRQFLGGVAAVSAVTGLSFAGSGAFRAAAAPADDAPTTLFTSCHQCDQQCAALATVHNGVLTKLDGNPKDVKSAGHLCPKGQGGIMDLYSPYRLKTPLVRTNPQKGFDVDPGWKQVSWDEAIATIAAKMKDVLASDGPRAFAGDDANLVGPLFSALGSPNTYRCGNTCYYNTNGIQAIVLGGTFTNAYLQKDVTRYALLFSDTVGTVENPFARNVAEAKAGGAKIAVLDPRLSEAAAKADVWAPIIPGTDLAAMLAIINVLITEDIYDHDFVAAKTVGIEQLTQFIQQYTPEWAEPITGVSADVLRTMGEDLGNRRPSVVVIRRGAAKQRKEYWRFVHAWAIANALVGGIDMPGTTIADRSVALGKVSPPQPVPKPYPQAVDSREQLLPTPGGAFDSPLSMAGVQDAFADALLNGAYPIKFLLCAGANWILSSPNTDQWVKILQDPSRFLTVIDYQMTDTAWFADVVLPCPTYLERDEVVSANNFAPVPQVQVRQAVVTPLYDTKSEGDIFALLGAAVGFSDYLAPTDQNAMDAQLKPLGVTFDQLKQQGLVQPNQPFTPATKFKTPSGKIEMYSSLLEQAGFDPLPTWTGPAMTPTDDYPLYFVSFNIARGYMSQHAWNPWLSQPDDYGVWINAKTAADKGISNGDQVKVTSAYGSLTAPAKVVQGIRPDTVGMIHGRGYRNPWTAPDARLGANDNDIGRPGTVADHLDWYQSKQDPVGGVQFRDITVAIEKA